MRTAHRLLSYLALGAAAACLIAKPVIAATEWNGIKRISQHDNKTANDYAAKVTFGSSSNVVKVELSFEITGVNGTVSNRDNVQAYHQLFPYGECSTASADKTYHDALVSHLPSDGNLTASYNSVIEVNKTANPNLWGSLGGDTFAEFCLRISVVPSTTNDTAYASYEADVRVRIPDTYDSALSLDNNIVQVAAETRDGVTIEIRYTVQACVCTDLESGYHTCLSSPPAFKMGANLQLCVEPASVLNSNGTVTYHVDHDTTSSVEITHVTEWVVSQSTGVVGVDSEGVNIMGGGSFRRAVVANQTDSITSVQIVHAEPETFGGARRFKVVSESSNSTKVVVMSTVMNQQFYIHPDLNLTTSGSVYLAGKSSRRRHLLPEGMEEMGAGSVAELVNVRPSLAMAGKETLETTMLSQVSAPEVPKAAFGMVFKLDEDDKVDMNPPPPPPPANDTPKAVLAGMASGIFVSLICIHATLYLLGFRISFDRARVVPRYTSHRGMMQYEDSRRIVNAGSEEEGFDNNKAEHSVPVV